MSTTTHEHKPIDNSFFRSIIRGKTRIGLAWIFAAILVFSAREFPIWPGIVLCFVGATLRFWASGFLRKDSKVAVGGPYAFTRNPLYLGTYFMALGTALAIQNWWLFGAGTVLFAVIYHFIILDEENKLSEIFGQPYLRYSQLVPRFFPRPGPVSRQKLEEVNSNSEHFKFSWELATKNKAHEAYVSFAGLIGLVWLIAYIWQYFAR